MQLLTFDMLMLTLLVFSEVLSLTMASVYGVGPVTVAFLTCQYLMRFAASVLVENISMTRPV